MFDLPQRRSWRDCEQRLDACTEEFSAAQNLFKVALQLREDIYARIRDAEKARDTAQLAELHRQAAPLEAKYDVAARAFAEAQRNLEIACQECQRAISGSGMPPPEPSR